MTETQTKTETQTETETETETKNLSSLISGDYNLFINVTLYRHQGDIQACVYNKYSRIDDVTSYKVCIYRDDSEDIPRLMQAVSQYKGKDKASNLGNNNFIKQFISGLNADSQSSTKEPSVILNVGFYHKDNDRKMVVYENEDAVTIFDYNPNNIENQISNIKETVDNILPKENINDSSAADKEDSFNNDDDSLEGIISINNSTEERSLSQAIHVRFRVKPAPNFQQEIHKHVDPTALTENMILGNINNDSSGDTHIKPDISQNNLSQIDTSEAASTSTVDIPSQTPTHAHGGPDDSSNRTPINGDDSTNSIEGVVSFVPQEVSQETQTQEIRVRFKVNEPIIPYRNLRITYLITIFNYLNNKVLNGKVSSTDWEKYKDENSSLKTLIKFTEENFYNMDLTRLLLITPQDTEEKQVPEEKQVFKDIINNLTISNNGINANSFDNNPKAITYILYGFYGDINHYADKILGDHETITYFILMLLHKLVILIKTNLETHNETTKLIDYSAPIIYIYIDAIGSNTKVTKEKEEIEKIIRIIKSIEALDSKYREVSTHISKKALKDIYMKKPNQIDI